MADVNDMIVNYQTADLLASIVGQATGTVVISPVTASEFVSVAQLGLKTGYDPLSTAISQVLAKTIFSVRPYTAKFRGLRMDAQRWGNHVRKVNTIDKPFLDAERYALEDGAHSPDMFDVHKPETIQTNFYGVVPFDDCVTVYRDQLDVAFSSEEEFARFVAMIMQNMADKLEQARENLSRGVISNLIKGVYLQAADGIAPERVIHLVTEYNNENGTALTADDVLLPANFPSFARWMFGYLKTVSDRMTNRSALYHQNFVLDDEPKYIMRHTPVERQKCYLYSPLLNNISANVLSTVFYQRYLQLMDHEDVDFWQNITDPMTIDYAATYTDDEGQIVSEDEDYSAQLSNIFGVIFDEEAAGYTQVGEWTATSPFEAAGGYTNYWYHLNFRYFNDFTENVVILLLDEATEEGGGADDGGGGSEQN